MELRHSEAEVQALTELYQSLQLRWTRYIDDHFPTTLPDDHSIRLPPLLISSNNNNNTIPNTNDDKVNDGTPQDSTATPSTGSITTTDHSMIDTTTTTITTTTTTTATQLQSEYQMWCQRLTELGPILTKFQQRLRQTDPITQQPRYGGQTQQRVRTMIQSYESLLQVFVSVPVEEEETLPTTTTTTTTNPRLSFMEECAQAEQMEQQQQLNVVVVVVAPPPLDEERRRLEQEEANRVARLQQEQVAFRQQTELLAQQRQATEERQRRADLLFLASIPHRNTLLGVQVQLQRFLENWIPHDDNDPPTTTTTTTTTLSVSLSALYTVFQQIVQHPDVEAHRRIRRDHAQFRQEIGQYPGGIELLLAAGFTTGLVDSSIPSYICREPNVETDLDAWSDWYDLLKGTLQLIKTEMVRHGIKH